MGISFVAVVVVVARLKTSLADYSNHGVLR